MITRGPATRLPRAWRAALGDAALTLFVTAVGLATVVSPRGDSERGIQLHALGIAFAIAGGLAVAARRRAPEAVLVVGLTAMIGQVALVNEDTRVGILTMAVAVYTLATRRSRTASLRAALWAVGLTDVALLVRAAGGELGALGDTLFVTVVVLGSWAIGDNVGTRRAYLAALVERAQRLESEHDAHAQRAVLGERARIARELHDVVAHHVSAIAVTAGAAEEIAEADPVRAREALAVIGSTSRQALTEMRALVGVLHEEDEVAALAPQPTMEQIDRLAAQSRAAGLEVRLRVDGTPRALPAALDLCAYRIVQEALTNTLKHAGATHAEVVVRYAQDDLELTVTDDGSGVTASPAAGGLPGGGRGIVGMRERVALFHGRLDVGRGPEGGFRVHAMLPTPGAAA